jgi:hypothetical protein
MATLDAMFINYKSIGKKSHGKRHTFYVILQDSDGKRFCRMFLATQIKAGLADLSQSVTEFIRSQKAPADWTDAQTLTLQAALQSTEEVKDNG